MRTLQFVFLDSVSSKSKTVLVESNVFVCVFARCVVSNQHAYQWPGTFGSKLPHQGSVQGSLYTVSFWRQNKNSRWDWQIIVTISVLLFLSSQHQHPWSYTNIALLINLMAIVFQSLLHYELLFLSLYITKQPPCHPWWWVWTTLAWPLTSP